MVIKKRSKKKRHAIIAPAKSVNAISMVSASVKNAAAMRKISIRYPILKRAADAPVECAMVKCLLAFLIFLNSSCIALAQEDLEFIDFRSAVDMPEFVLQDMNGHVTYESSDYFLHAFVIEFYFNSCPACNQNADNVKKLQHEFAGKPHIQIVELSIDCDDWAYTNWMSKHPPLGAVLNGCNADIVDTLNVHSFPTTYVFAPNRKQAMRGVGVWSGSTYNHIRDYLNQVSKESQP